MIRFPVRWSRLPFLKQSTITLKSQRNEETQRQAKANETQTSRL